MWRGAVEERVTWMSWASKVVVYSRKRAVAASNRSSSATDRPLPAPYRALTLSQYQRHHTITLVALLFCSSGTSSAACTSRAFNNLLAANAFCLPINTPKAARVLPRLRLDASKSTGIIVYTMYKISATSWLAETLAYPLYCFIRVRDSGNRRRNCR